jgi:hypothetical protein
MSVEISYYSLNKRFFSLYNHRLLVSVREELNFEVLYEFLVF